MLPRFLSTSHCPVAAALLLALSLFFGTNSAAFAQAGPPPGTSGDLYAAYYGDGLRHYAEGNYVGAVENLFRAYALQPSAGVLRLIVRSYDFMGHCGAAQKQQVFFTEMFPRESSPKLQQCQETASLALECLPFGTPVTVNRFVETYCGAEIQVAPGKLYVESPAHVSAQTLIVKPGERAVAHIKVEAQKWSQSVARRSPIAEVPRLQSSPSQYAVYQSPDGLYQIWVRSDLRSDPDMVPLDSYALQPRVEIVCAEDNLDEERGCLLLRQLQESSRGYTDDPLRHKMLIPKIP
ncbi:MAG: hypothetical protein H0U74_03225 [Bradymonadaceae bacterium]|nr:hypothetical protein [Lujinxingiaceae bacterium]